MDGASAQVVALLLPGGGEAAEGLPVLLRIAEELQLRLALAAPEGRPNFAARRAQRCPRAQPTVHRGPVDDVVIHVLRDHVQFWREALQEDESLGVRPGGSHFVERGFDQPLRLRDLPAH